MLFPIATWTRRSLQFQPPDTIPSGVSRQPFAPRTDSTRSAKAAATIHAGASARRAPRISLGISRTAGNDHGASHRWRIRVRTTVARTSRPAAMSTATRPNPSRRLTSSTRWAERYVLATTPTPTMPGRGSSGATRRTKTQPGTANSHGQTTTIARIGIDQVRTSPAVSPRMRARAGVEGTGSNPKRSSLGGCTEGR